MAADRDTADSVDWTPWVYVNIEWGGRRGAARPVLLTIHFGEHYLNLEDGQVSFGLLKGELQLTPSAGKFSSNFLWPKNLAESTVDAERKARQEQRSMTGAQLELAEGVAKGAVSADTKRQTRGGKGVEGLDHRCATRSRVSNCSTGSLYMAT